MKILEYFEKAWIAAAVASIVVMLYNAITLRVFDHHIYFPFFCSLFCVLIWYNLRRQRLFRDEIMKERDEKATREK